MEDLAEFKVIERTIREATPLTPNPSPAGGRRE
jgi:hypothetical protein